MIDWKFEGLDIEELKEIIVYLEDVEEFHDEVMKDIKLNFSNFEITLLFGYNGLESVDVKREGE